MKLKFITIIAITIAMALCSCASKKAETDSAESNITLAPILIGATQPKAIAYKMSGQASAANVPVQVDNNGNIVSYPDPSDLKNAEPIALKNGYLLDRRGISKNSRFLRYTYSEYSSLKTPPSLSELKASIIPDARVSEIVQLPLTVSQAVADIDAVNAMLP